MALYLPVATLLGLRGRCEASAFHLPGSKLASWAGLTPTVRGSDSHRPARAHFQAGLRVAALGPGQAAQTAKRFPEFSATYAAISRRRGKKIATIAIVRKRLTRAYHLLAAGALPVSGAAGTTTPRKPGGSLSPGRARYRGMSRPPAGLDHLTEQPGPRTHGHGARLLTGAAPDGCLRDHSACHTPGTAHDPSQARTGKDSSSPHDRLPLVGVQLVRPRRYAGCGRWTPPARRRKPGAAARKIPKNSQGPSRRHHSSHRVKDPCPLDSGDPHGCRNTVRSVRHDVTEWRLRSWIDRYLGRRLAVMSQLIADTGHFRGRPRAAPADSPTKCFVTGRVTEDTVAAQKRRLCLRARYHWPLGMLLNVFLI